jgi:hypothetical protein
MTLIDVIQKDPIKGENHGHGKAANGGAPQH